MSFSRCELSNGSDYTCGICSDDFTKNTDAVFHPNGGKKHPLHPICVKVWMLVKQADNAQPSCPMCNYNVEKLEFSWLTSHAEFCEVATRQWDEEKEFEMRVSADSVRLSSEKGHGASSVESLDLEDLNTNIPDKGFRVYTLRVCIAIAASKGYNELKVVLQQKLARESA